MSTQLLRIEVIQAWPQRQVRVHVLMPQGSRVADALAHPEVTALWPDAGQAAFGVFGRLCRGERMLHDGDRIELYRELLIDPKAARRERAARG